MLPYRASLFPCTALLVCLPLKFMSSTMGTGVRGFARIGMEACYKAEEIGEQGRDVVLSSACHCGSVD